MPVSTGPEARIRSALTADPAAPLTLFSPARHRFFHLMFARFARAHLRAIRVAEWGLPPPSGNAPVVVFAAHPSWWDGVAFMLLAARLMPERRMFIPMEAAALARYGFMRRIGVFGVETGSGRAAIGFLRTAQAILAAPCGMLWMNAPGRFADVRERPQPIAPGLVRLAELAPGARFLPLALEYPFWSEKAPEMLAAFGPPIEAATLAALDRRARADALARALEATMDRLAADAIARDPTRFRTVLQGREGMGGIWQAWRRTRATLRGERFDPRHDPGRDPGRDMGRPA